MANRRFKRPGGFFDATEYVEVDDNGKVSIVDKRGHRSQVDIDLQFCLDAVRDGDWVEIEVA